MPEGGDVGQVEDTVQIHVDDGDVQVAEGIWRGRSTQDTVIKIKNKIALMQVTMIKLLNTV